MMPVMHYNPFGPWSGCMRWWEKRMSNWSLAKLTAGQESLLSRLGKIVIAGDSISGPLLSKRVKTIPGRTFQSLSFGAQYVWRVPTNVCPRWWTNRTTPIMLWGLVNLSALSLSLSLSTRQTNTHSLFLGQGVRVNLHGTQLIPSSIRSKTDHSCQK